MSCAERSGDFISFSSPKIASKAFLLAGILNLNSEYQNDKTRVKICGLYDALMRVAMLLWRGFPLRLFVVVALAVDGV